MSSTSQVSTLEQPAPGRRAERVATPSGSPATVKVNAHDVALSGKKVLINIHPSEGIAGDEAVPVGLNGFVYQIPRGTPCEIPEEVYFILRDAVTRVVTTGTDGSEVYRDVPRHAFTVQPA